MGWVRTCFSIIGFGFTIYSFFLGHDKSTQDLADRHVQQEIMCLALTLGGTIFMALAVVEYHLAMRKLFAKGLEMGFSMVAALTSVLVCGAGMLGTWVILIGWR